MSYLLNSASSVEPTRLGAIGAAYDRGTREHLLQLGVSQGSRVLILGAGSGTFLPWLAGIVGAQGEIVATDTDLTRLLPLAAAHPAIVPLRHDFLLEELPEPRFDVVHGRLILIHYPERETVVAKMARSLKPGGWLLLEDYDWGSYGPAFACEPATVMIAKLREFYQSKGFDPYVGRKLPTFLRRAGLVDVDAAGRVLTLRGATSPLTTLYSLSHDQIGPQATAQGLIDADDDRLFRERMANPEFDMTGQTMMAAWGRRKP